MFICITVLKEFLELFFGLSLTPLFSITASTRGRKIKLLLEPHRPEVVAPNLVLDCQKESLTMVHSSEIDYLWASLHLLIHMHQMPPPEGHTLGPGKSLVQVSILVHMHKEAGLLRISPSFSTDIARASYLSRTTLAAVNTTEQVPGPTEPTFQ